MISADISEIPRAIFGVYVYMQICECWIVPAFLSSPACSRGPAFLDDLVCSRVFGVTQKRYAIYGCFWEFLGLVMPSVMSWNIHGVMAVFGLFGRKRVMHTLH